MDALTEINTRRTPQTEPANERQVPNAAGGYGFKVGDKARVHRFLTLGTSGGTYYASERELTKSNADVILRAARERPEWLTDSIVEISTTGRAPRQNPAIFALAAVAGLANENDRATALAVIPTVCRTGTHLFLFTKYVQQFRGWGPALRRAVNRWYLTKDVDDLAYQMVKYRQRDGVAQRDVLRLAHPHTTEPGRRALFNWAVNGNVETSREPDGKPRPVGATRSDLPVLVDVFIQAQTTTEVTTWIRLIEQHPISHEMLPDIAKTEPDVWRALIRKGMPQTALMRQLPRLTRLGVLTGEDRDIVTTQLADPDRLRKARVHPVNVLVAARTYAGGHSIQGSSEWSPVRQVVDALDAAFYAAFGVIEPAGKRTLLALDVSGSMGYLIPDHAKSKPRKPVFLPISSREVSAALALVTMASESQCDVVGFTAVNNRNRWAWRSEDNAITELSISPRQRLDDAIRAISDLPFGGTDCALPMVWAKKNRREYDTIVILTDNESWAGDIHPHQALRDYRQFSGINTRLVVVSMTATETSISDPDDFDSLDVAGFDSAIPNLIADFSRGTL